MASGDVVPANPDLLDEMEDLTRLSFLNEPSILHNLLGRFQRDKIYSSAGSVLVAINPFRPVRPEHRLIRICVSSGCKSRATCF